MHGGSLLSSNQHSVRTITSMFILSCVIKTKNSSKLRFTLLMLTDRMHNDDSLCVWQRIDEQSEGFDISWHSTFGILSKSLVIDLSRKLNFIYKA